MSKSSRSAKAEDFLSKMGLIEDPAETDIVEPITTPVANIVATLSSPKTKTKSSHRLEGIKSEGPKQQIPKSSKAPPSRVKLKHIGAYLEREDCEKIALLRARLELDNSQLIALAINNLYKTESAKRKFGDA
jgi:hypothetical protein